jgi:hypothetical protein
MAKINGTLVVLYADGQPIALQRGLDISYEQDLPDTSTKDSAGWAEHMNGRRSAKIELDALFSTTGVSGAALIAYITGRTSLLAVITGGVAAPFVGQVDVSSVKLSAPAENPLAVAGSLSVTGPLFQLAGGNAQLITDPDTGGTDYDTHTESGTGFTSLINAAGTAYAKSNTFAVTTGDIIKVATFLTVTSGEVPSMAIFEVGGGAAAISNVVALTAGLNLITLTCTDSHDGCLNISNTGACSLVLSDIYAFKYVPS